MANTDKLADGNRGFVAHLLADTLLAGFAASLGRAQVVVQATLDFPWTTSLVEGQVNRVETIKRSMYGRAGFDLLRTRILHAA